MFLNLPFVVLYSRGCYSLRQCSIVKLRVAKRSVSLLSSGKKDSVKMEVGKENLQMMGRYPAVMTAWKVRYPNLEISDLLLSTSERSLLLSHFTDRPTKI